MCSTPGSPRCRRLLLERQIQRCYIWQAAGAGMVRCWPWQATPAARHTRPACRHAMLLLLAWRRLRRHAALLLARQVWVGIPQCSHGGVHGMQAGLDAICPRACQAAAQRLEAALGGLRCLLVPAGRKARASQGRLARNILLAAALAGASQLADCHAAASRLLLLLLLRQGSRCLGVHAHRLKAAAQRSLAALWRRLCGALGRLCSRRRCLLLPRVVGWIGDRALGAQATASAGRELALGPTDALCRVSRRQRGLGRSRRCF